MKPYIVWTDYGLEGWKPDEADTFEEAISVRERQMSFGNSSVIITRLIEIRYEESAAGKGRPSK